jgi:hypothetical protein
VPTALIKIDQGGLTDLAGRALKGVAGSSAHVVFSNGDDTGVTEWKYELLYVPPGSAIVLWTQGPGPLATFDIGAADAPGSYRVRLTVKDISGNTDVDIRNFIIPFPTSGFLAPPYQRYPEQLPLVGVGAKPDEMNVGGQGYGWAGDLDSSRFLLHKVIQAIDLYSGSPVSLVTPTIAGTISALGTTANRVFQTDGTTAGGSWRPYLALGLTPHDDGAIRLSYSDAITFETSDATGRWAINTYDATFNGVVDHTTRWAFNGGIGGLHDPALPSWGMQMEATYKPGPAANVISEWFIQYLNAGATVERRPIAASVDNVTNNADVATTGSFTVVNNAAQTRLYIPNDGNVSTHYGALQVSPLTGGNATQINPSYGVMFWQVLSQQVNNFVALECLNAASTDYIEVARVNATDEVVLAGGAAAKAASAIRLSTALLRFGSDIASPQFYQQDLATPGGVGQPLLVHAQDSTGGGTGGKTALRAGHGAAHGVLALQDADGADRVVVNASGNVDANGATMTSLSVGGSLIAYAGAGQFSYNVSNLLFNSDVSTPTIWQYNSEVDDATGQTMVIHAQDCTVGDATVGGNLELRPGHGATHGQLLLQSADGAARLTVDADGDVQVVGGSDVTLSAGGNAFLYGTGSVVKFYKSNTYWDTSTASPALYQENAAAGASGQDLSITAQAGGTGDTSGGDLVLSGGAKSGTGAYGGVKLPAATYLQFGADAGGGAGSAAAQGTLRFGPTQSWYVRNHGDTDDICFYGGVDESGYIYIGHTTGEDHPTPGMIFGAQGLLIFRVAGINTVWVDASSFKVFSSNLVFGNGAYNTVWSPQDYDASGPFGPTSLTIRGADCTFTGSYGNDVYIRPGKGEHTADDGDLFITDARGNNLVTIVAGVLNLYSPVLAAGDIVFDKTLSGPDIYQATSDIAGATGFTLTIHAQDMIGTGATVGGKFALRAGHGATSGVVAMQDADGVDRIWVNADTGITLAGLYTDIGSAWGPTAIRVSSAGAVQIFTNLVVWGSAVSAPLLYQESDATAGVTADLLTISSQSATDATAANYANGLLLKGGDVAGLLASTAGNVQITAGSATAAGVGSVGGNVVITPGHAETYGEVKIRDSGSVDRIIVHSTGDVDLVGATKTLLTTASGGGITIWSTETELTSSALFWDRAISSPVLYQENNTSGSAVGQAFAVHAQDCTGTASVGGEFSLRAGHGVSGNGKLALRTADNIDAVTVYGAGGVTIAAVATQTVVLKETSGVASVTVKAKVTAFAGGVTTEHVDVITTSHTVALSDVVLLVDVVTAAGDVWIYLPAATTAAGMHLWVKITKGDIRYGVVLQPNGADQIDGAAYKVLPIAVAGAGEAAHLFCCGVAWWILTYYDDTL